MLDGILVTIIGLCVVFFVLICLIGAVMLMSRALSSIKDKAPAPAPKAPVASAVSSEALSAATLAAICASIATVMDKEVSGLKIVSIKKV